MAGIRLTKVCKVYEGASVPVIREVDLEIQNGQLCVFVGPSGCGKSTLLRMIAGLEDITSGDLYIGQDRMNDVAAAKRGIAMVFQSYALYPHMTVFENMAFGLEMSKTPRDEIKTRVNQAAKILQLEHLLERKPNALSGGQRQRVAIGRAIVRQPGAFLFDEPLSNLDAALRVQTRLEIANLKDAYQDACMVYVTHDQVEAMTLADKIVLLNAGQNTIDYGSVAQQGTPLELYEHPRSLFVAGFIGSPQMNFLKGVVSSIEVDGVTVRLNSGESLKAAVEGQTATLGQAVTLGIRPEHIDASASQSIRRQVLRSEHLGDMVFVYCSNEGEGMLSIKSLPHALTEMTGTIQIGIPSRECHLFDEHGWAFKRLV
ncbi:MAG: ABC transporter ATP-binding protein [Formosimonas sp.]